MPAKNQEVSANGLANAMVAKARSGRLSNGLPRLPGERSRRREGAAPQPDVSGPEWELVLRIAASHGFARSTLLTNFLLFIAHKALTGEAASINEQQIGVHVFGRQQQFNRSDDNIVRNYARMLRKRVDSYFLHHGCDEPLRVHIARGGYVPVFGAQAPEIADVSVTETTVSAGKTGAVELLALDGQSNGQIAGKNAPTSLLWMAALLVLTSLLVGFAIARMLPPGSLHRQGNADRLTDNFWRTLFAGDRDTFIVPSDGGLVILHRFLERPTTLSAYVSGAYRSPDVVEAGLRALSKTTSPVEIPLLSRKVETLGDRRYTSMVDLDLASRISRRREVVPERLLIRYARELRMDDLKTGNAILIGSVDANPWVELFQPQLNFQFTYGGAFGGSATILNRQPRAGEALTYASIGGDPAQETYGVIAYVPNLGGTGHVLIVEGINMAGTQVAGEFLLNPVQMQSVLQRATRSNGEMGSFEILLGTSSIAANSSEPKVLSERVAPL